MQEPAGREPRLEALEQRFGKLAFFRSQCRVVPFGPVHVVDRHERRLAALCQADIMGREISVDRFAQRVDRRPLRVAVRLGHARVFVHARHLHGKVELDVADVGIADDRRRIARIGSARKRNMTFAGEQSRSWIEADPARAREIHFGPGVQIGEIALRPGWTLERLLIRGELDQISGREACGEPEIAQDLHQQPARIAARAAGLHKRLVRLLHSGLHPHQVTDLVLQLVVEANQHGDGVVALLDRGAKRCEPGGEAWADGRGLEKRNQLLGERRRVGERKSFGIRLDEKVEGINDRHVGGQTDEHVEFVGAFGKDQARDPIAVRVLLPVQKVPWRLHRE